MTDLKDVALQLYFKEIGAIPHLSRTEERQLLERMQVGGPAAEAARERLIEAHLGFVVAMAKRHSSAGIPVMDLVQEGNVGLMRAVRKFDYGKLGRRSRFSTYARRSIHDSLNLALAKHAHVVSLSAGMEAEVKHFKDALSRLYVQNGSKPTPEQLAQVMDLTVAHVWEVARAAMHALSLDAPIDREALLAEVDLSDEEDLAETDDPDRLPESSADYAAVERRLLDLLDLNDLSDADEPYNLLDIIASDQSCDPEHLVMDRVQRQLLIELLDCLSERERLVVVMRFGMFAVRAHTLEEVSSLLKITPTQVAHIQSSALGKLRRSEQLFEWARPDYK